MNTEKPHKYQFGPFLLDPSEGKLLRDGKIVTLTPKALEALVFLVRKPGRLIEKEELIASLWPDTFVEEANLAHHIWRLRKALDDTKDDERYIETVPKRGYRFIAPIVMHSSKASLMAGRTDLNLHKALWLNIAELRLAEERRRARRRQLKTAATVAAIVVSVAVALFFALR